MTDVEQAGKEPELNRVVVEDDRPDVEGVRSEVERPLIPAQMIELVEDENPRPSLRKPFGRGQPRDTGAEDDRVIQSGVNVDASVASCRCLLRSGVILTVPT